MFFRSFVQGRPLLTLALVVAGWLLVPTLVKRWARVSFFEMQAPFEVAASVARDLQDFWAVKTRSKNELIEAGREIARLNASYELRLQADADLRAEISRLETLLNLPSFPEYRSEPARVATRDLSGWWQTLVIRKGANYALKVDSPVIFVGGAVGRIAEVNTTTAVVELISSPRFRLAASIEGDARPISYRGSGSPPFFPAQGMVEFVPLDLSATRTAPQRLVTSGLGGFFPPGLTLGQIVRLEPGPDGLFKTGEVTLDPRLSELTEVTVLVPLEK